MHDEAKRKLYEDDNWSSYPEDRGPGQPPPSIWGDVELSAESIAAARKVLEEIGYEIDAGMH